MSYAINEQYGLNPDMHAAPLRMCMGGPADGLSRKVHDGAVLLCALVTPREMNTVAIEYDPSVELSIAMGSYAGHYVIDGDVLLFQDDRR